MTDLRKIAINLNNTPEHEWTESDGAAATLLNAVIEERTKVIRVTQRQRGLPEPRVFTEAEAKEVALRELNLEGVWPKKEQE